MKKIIALFLVFFPTFAFGMSGQYDVTYYSDAFEGKGTAFGDIFTQDSFSSAICEIPLGSLILLSLDEKNIALKANDRPNCAKYPGLIDVSKRVFSLFGQLGQGKISGAEVTVLGTLPDGYEKKTFSKDVFASLGIELNGEIPNTFLTNETLRFRGNVTNEAKTVTVFLSRPNEAPIAFSDSVASDGSFSLLLPGQEKAGQYSLSVTTEDTNFSIPIWLLDESLLDSAPIPTVGQKDSFPKFSLLSELLPLTRIDFGEDFYTFTLKQGNTEIRASGMGEILLDVDNLVSGTASVDISGYTHSTPFSTDLDGRYTLFGQKIVTLVPQYPKLQPAGVRLVATKTDGILRFVAGESPRIEGEIYVTIPSGEVRKYTLPSEYLDSDGYVIAGKSVVFSFPIEGDGVYLVEIADVSGKAWVNTPLITGRDIYPILPSPYYGISPRKETSSATVNKNQQTLINNFRALFGLEALTEDTTLMRVAQEKADDMLANHYVGHTDSSGKTIGQMAESFGTMTRIGENVAGGNQGDAILFEGLKLSGSHRYNLLSPEWKKVGIGYATVEGEVYLVQVFGN